MACTHSAIHSTPSHAICPEETPVAEKICGRITFYRALMPHAEGALSDPLSGNELVGRASTELKVPAQQACCWTAGPPHHSKPQYSLIMKLLCQRMPALPIRCTIAVPLLPLAISILNRR